MVNFFKKLFSNPTKWLKKHYISNVFLSFFGWFIIFLFFIFKDEFMSNGHIHPQAGFPLLLLCLGLYVYECISFLIYLFIYILEFIIKKEFCLNKFLFNKFIIFFQIIGILIFYITFIFMSYIISDDFISSHNLSWELVLIYLKYILFLIFVFCIVIFYFNYRRRKHK